MEEKSRKNQSNVREKKKAFKSANRPSKNRKGVPPAVRLVAPQYIPWGILFLLVYLLMAIITGSWHEGLIAEVIGSIRLLILTSGLFFTLLGLIGFIIHPEDRHKIIPRKIKRSR